MSAVQYHHQRRAVHGNLKPENILPDRELNINLTDFGFGTEFSDHSLHTFCGTNSHMVTESCSSNPMPAWRLMPGAWGSFSTLQDGDRRTAIRRENFEELKQHILNGQSHVSHFMPLELKHCYKKIDVCWLQPQNNPGRYNERSLGQYCPGRRSEAIHWATLGWQWSPGNRNNEDPWI